MVDYNASLTGKHLLVDMSPGTYNIYKNGQEIPDSPKIVETDKGTLYFESEGGATFSVTPSAPVDGDLTGDGLVNIDDVNACVRHILGTENHPAADVNEDGNVDVRDVQEIVKKVID